MKCTAIVLAGGQGKRMQSKTQKQYLDILGHPVLFYSLKCFQDCSWIQNIVLVSSEAEFCQREIIEKYQFTKVTKIVPGGKERYHSVFNGLKVCRDTDYVFIHDGARPFVDCEMLKRGLECVKIHGACAAGVPSKDTVKIIREDGSVLETPDRKYVWNIQTPQVFSYELVYGAYEKALSGECAGITDDAMVVEKYGMQKVYLYEGAYENIKITTPEDLIVAEAFVKKNKKM